MRNMMILTSAAALAVATSAMAAKPDKPCDAPTYLIPGLPVTMAQLNLLYALLLGGFGLREALRRHA